MEKFKTFFMCAHRTENEHFVQDPILLSCGHTVCSKCIWNTIKCGICGRDNENRSYNRIHVKHELLSILINDHLQELLHVVCEKFKKLLNDCIDDVSTFDDKIYNKIDFAKDEITIRIESLKTELDSISDKLKSQLDSLKEEYNVKKIEYKSMFPEFDENKFKNDLDNMEKSMKKKITTEYFYSCQDKLHSLEEIKKDINSMQPDIRFKASEKETLTNIVGKIKHNLIFSNISNIRLVVGDSHVRPRSSYKGRSNCSGVNDSDW